MLRTFASSSSRAIRAARAVRFNSTQAAPQQSTAYIVERTANGTLPVYSDVKGNATRTIIRRIRGSAEVSFALGRDRDWAGAQWRSKAAGAKQVRSSSGGRRGLLPVLSLLLSRVLSCRSSRDRSKGDCLAVLRLLVRVSQELAPCGCHRTALLIVTTS